jgi:restriction system protein
MSAAEIAPRLTVVAIVCLAAAIYVFPYGGSGPVVVVVLVVAAAAALAWKRAAQSRAAYAKTGLTREAVRALSPTQFEKWCAARIRERGYRVTEVGGQGDHGIDLIAEREGERLVVQCKRWLGVRLVGEPQVRDLFGAMHHERATGAMVITTGVFSDPAIAWSAGKAIQLLDVDHMLADTPLDAIRPTAVAESSSRSCPRCGSALVRRANRRTQEPFLACSGFPRCRYTQPVS